MSTGDGCDRLGWYSENSALLESGGSTAAPSGTTEQWPLDPTDHITYYDYTDFNADNLANSINRTKLDRTNLMCFDVNVPCNDMALILEIGATVVFDPDNQGISRFLVEIDGQFPVNAAGETIATSYFTSYEGTINSILNLTLAMGTHTICIYVIGGLPSKNMAQLRVQNTTGAQRPVYRLSQRIN